MEEEKHIVSFIGTYRCEQWKIYIGKYEYSQCNLHFALDNLQKHIMNCLAIPKEILEKL